MTNGTTTINVIIVIIIDHHRPSSSFGLLRRTTTRHPPFFLVKQSATTIWWWLFVGEDQMMLDCFQLLHFHIGSQIPSTALLADGVGEAAQIYCELVRLGANMKVIDIGGGLGIDYDGSKSANSDVSVAYGLEEYAMAVVQAVKFVSDRNSVKHPVVCSESGRALVSHHSVLIFEAVSSSKYTVPPMSSFDIQHFIEQLPEDAHSDYNNLSESAIRGDYEACLAYADQLKQRCVEKFKDGSLDIEQLAATDGLCDLVAKEIGVSNPVSTYHVNLSVFTSIPDFWGIEQVFPILPIHCILPYTIWWQGTPPPFG